MEPWQTFVTTLASSLTWPIVVLVLGITFRKTLRAVLARVTGVDALGAKLQFAAEIKQLDLKGEKLVAEEAAAPRRPREARPPVDKPTPEPGAHTPDESAAVDDESFGGMVTALLPPPPSLAASSPEAMIITSWIRLENALRALCSILPSPGSGRSRSGSQTVYAVADRLHSAGIISPEVLNLINGLRRVRNEVVHTGVLPTEGQAAVFVGVVYNVVSILERKTEEMRAA